MGHGTIVKITPAGAKSTFASLSGNFWVQGLAFDSAGNLYAMAENQSDPNLASTIFKFTRNGVQSTFGTVPGQGFGLAFDSAGNLFAADAGLADTTGRTIWKFAPDGTRTVFADSSKFPTNNGPIGLAFDRFGNLFASTESGSFNDPSNVVLKFTPTGVVSTFASGLAHYPRGLAFDSNNNLFVAEVGENPSNPPGDPGDILRFQPNGREAVFASNIVPGGDNSGPEFLVFQSR